MSNPYREIIRRLDELVKARFVEIFGDPFSHEQLTCMSEVCDFYSGTGFPEVYQGIRGQQYPFYKVGDISVVVQSGNKIMSDCKNTVNNEIVKKLGGTLIPPGTVVFAKIGEAIKLNRRAITSIDCLVDNNAMGVKPKIDLLDIDYFYQVMCMLDLVKYSSGTTAPSVRKNVLEKVKIYVPPMKDQRAFGAFVHQVDKSKFIAQQAAEKYDLLVKSRFIEMFGTLANPKYGRAKVSEFVSDHITKVSKKYSPEDTIQYIDISSIDKDSRVIVGMTEYVMGEAPSRAQQCVQKGDILLSNVRPNLKTIAIVASDENNLVCSSGFTVLRCKDSEPEYIITAILNDYFTDNLMKKANGSNYPAVTSKDVLNGLIPAAPKECQSSFAEFVKQVDKSKFIESGGDE